MLRPGNAGSNTAQDHIEVTKPALAQLPARQRRRMLIRADCGGGTHDFLTWLTAPGRRLTYSVGMTITEDIHQETRDLLLVMLNAQFEGKAAGRRRGHDPDDGDRD